MRIISVNVNGIQAAVERGLFAWLQAQNADVICLQDTRASVFEMDDPAFQLDGYFLYCCDAEVPSQGGVALYSRQQPKAVITGLGFESADRYGRYLQADFDKVSIASLLLPSGMKGDEDLNQKFKFIDDFTHYLNKQRRKRREYIYCGSLYVAQQKLDVKNWRDCQQAPGFLAPERAWLDEVFATWAMSTRCAKSAAKASSSAGGRTASRPSCSTSATASTTRSSLRACAARYAAPAWCASHASPSTHHCWSITTGP
jgi:exodeoxyribonuclease-3